jgi:ornithine cyclodeaminase/alanine dehydrogenase-like protein (mu-crystallin family)
VNAVPPLRWLSAGDVEAAMPDLPDRLALAEQTLIALVRDAELPSKIAVHPRPDGAFAHAMPAFLRGPEPAADRLGIKWVAGFATNLELGLPAISAVVVLSDAATGVPVALLDGGPITAQRTAAVSGVAIRAFGPILERAPEVGLIGAGVQGHSHLPVIAAGLPGTRLRVHDRDQERAEGLAALARKTPGITSAEAVPDARDAVAGADVVMTAAAFGPVRQVMTNDWLSPGATVVAVDYATYCAAEVARDAALFLVDERGQFLANREVGAFDDYPDPMATIGEALLAGAPRPDGRVVVTHLGVGLADVVFGSAILERAERLGLGTILPR